MSTESTGSKMHNLAEKQELLNTRIRETLSECMGKVHSYDRDASVILYGSQARGQATAGSDLDLLVLLSSEISSELNNQIHDSLYEVALEKDIVICSIIKSRSSWEQPISRATPLYQSIRSEGILVA